MTICSLVIQTLPKQQKAVDEILCSMQGVEIHAKDENGKMVVTIDHPSREHCSRAMTEMSQIDGVLSTSLIFEYQEDLEKDPDLPAHEQVNLK